MFRIDTPSLIFVRRFFIYKVVFMSVLVSVQTQAQNTIHPASTEYVYPQDELVAENLENWRDQKFGIIIHWGLYAVPGIIESWTLCNEDWIYRDSMSNYNDYKRWYWGLNNEFNPTKFNPESWAKAAKDAGMKYVVFTTKHHDGFNMFDTEFSDFKISNGPFAGNEKADVANEVFKAFRDQNFLIGAYFSKPDWHSQYFWWDRYATPDRNVNYDIRKNPWRWNQYVNFTHNQLNELTTKYGKIDIVWLDGGWVRPRNTVTEEVRNWGAPIPDFDMQINMPKIAKVMRENQPGVLIVDRTVHGEFENYRTPEQGIPKEKSDNPWESCITLGGAWGYVPNDNFKSAETVVHKLIEIVAKGGNLLLGVGPTAEGEFLPEQIARLKEIGAWTSQFGEAIYGTRTMDTFKSGEVYFTKSKDKYAYALVTLSKENALTEVISWEGNQPKAGSEIYLVGSDKPLKWKAEGNDTKVWLTKSQQQDYKNQPAVALKFEF